MKVSYLAIFLSAHITREVYHMRGLIKDSTRSESATILYDPGKTRPRRYL